jgi:membrane protease YdiL (CAAX protease family)
MHDACPGATAYRCAGCQGVLRAGAQFCPSCGHTLGAAAVEPARELSEPAAGRFASQWKDIKRVVWLFGLLLLSSLVLGFVVRSNSTPWPDAVLSGIDAAIVLAFAATRHRDLRPLLSTPRLNRRSVLALGGIALIFVAAMGAYFDLLEHMGVPLARLSDTYVAAGWPVSAMLLLVSAMPAVFEELAFRGVIQSALERVVEWREAWLIQAALFSVLHLTPLAFPSHFLMGLCFGYMRTRSRSLYPGMLLHAAWNALVLLQELHTS